VRDKYAELSGELVAHLNKRAPNLENPGQEQVADLRLIAAQ